MDYESVVYGCIKDTVFSNDSVELEQHRVTNREVMLGLPSVEDWPLLSREMFSLPVPTALLNEGQTDVMHFGTSYKAVEYEWEHWIGKFEQLLKRMYWVSATVHLETEFNGCHTFIWEAAGEPHYSGQEALSVRCEWSRESLFA